MENKELESVIKDQLEINGLECISTFVEKVV